MIRSLARFIPVFAVVCAAALHAEDAASGNLPAYVLKNKSTFTPVSDEQRAPFWPIGWVKRKLAPVASSPVQAVEVPKVVLDARSFKLTSILIGNPSLAIINGRTYSEGEFLRTPRGAAAAAPLPRVRVYRINDGSVVLQNQEQLVTVALQRPELTQRSDKEELLLEDRP